MDLDWLDTPLDTDIGELLARRKRAKAIAALRDQVQGRVAPPVFVRLQLADLLIQAGRDQEAIPVLLGLADEFTSDGFVAKAIAILKRIEKIERGRPDVTDRLDRLVDQQHRAARRPPPTMVRPVLPELGIEVIDEIDVPPEALEPIDESGEPPVPDVEPTAPDVQPAALAAEAAVSAADVVAAAAVPVPAPEAGSGPPLAREPESGGVAKKIRGAFRRFLAALPGGAGVEETEPTTASAAAPVALEPEPAGGAEPETLTEAAFQEELLDIVEDVLHQPASPVPDPLPGRARTIDLAERLLASRLLRDLDENELLAVVQGLQLHTFGAGDVVVTEGEASQGLFLVSTGRVKVFVANPEGRNFQVAMIGEGDFFGEMSGLSGHPRTATVVAAAHSELLELDRPTLDGIARAHPRVRDILDASYVERASSADTAAVRAVALRDADAHRKAAEVLQAHFGESHWDRRMRLRLADVLLKAGKDEDALPILIELADELATSGKSGKAVAILKKIERIQHKSVEVVALAPLLRVGQRASASESPPQPPPRPPRAARGKPITDDRFHGWLLELVRDTVQPKARASELPAGAEAIRAYGPGLLANPLFEDFSEEELLAFIQGLRLLSFEPGDVIVTEGESGQGVFILTTGRVNVFVRAPDGKNERIGVLTEGSFFGEISTLSGRPRSATVTAAAPCEILELDRGGIDAIALRHPRVRTVLEEYSVLRETDPDARRARGGSPDAPV